MTDTLAPILQAIQSATKEQPVAIEQLRKIANREGLDAADLYLHLDELHISRKVARVSGMRDGKPTLAYWPLVELVPTEPAALPEPKRVHRLPAKSKVKLAVSPVDPVALRKELLQYITETPGACGRDLTKRALAIFPGADRNQVKHAARTILENGEAITAGKTSGLRYFPAGYDIDAGGQTTSEKPIAASPPPSAELDQATKAAQCADLLLSDMKALNKTRNPLVRELLSDLLPSAHQLKTKLARLAGHIQQLSA